MLIARGQHARKSREISHALQQVHKEREIAKCETPSTHGLTDQDQDRTCPQRGRISIQRAQDIIEQLLTDGQPAALVVQLVEMLDHILLGRRDLDGLHRSEEFSDKSGHLSCGLARGATKVLYAAGGRVRNQAHDDERRKRHQRDRRADAGHQENGAGDNQQAYKNVIDQDHKHGDLVHIIAEAADGFSR